MNRISLPNSVGGYAVQKDSETAQDAWIRSMERKLSIKNGRKTSLYNQRLDCWQQDRNGRTTHKTYQFTFCGPKSKYGGHPVYGEYFATFEVE